MRMSLLILCVAGSAILVSGQAPQTPAVPSGVVSITAQGQISADRVQRISPSTVQLRGSVRIVQGTAIITADEADAQTGPDGTIEFDLRGNVHLATNK